MALVAQRADNFSGQRCVKQINDVFAIRCIAFGDSTLFDVLTSTFANDFDIGTEMIGSTRSYSSLLCKWTDTLEKFHQKLTVGVQQPLFNPLLSVFFLCSPANLY